MGKDGPQTLVREEATWEMRGGEGEGVKGTEGEKESEENKEWGR